MTSRLLVTIDLQYAHSMCTDAYESHRQHEPAVFHVRKTFGENISHLVGHWNIFEFDILVSDAIPDKMVVNLNMLGMSMESWVDCECKSTLIIPKEGDWNGRRESDFT